jgi:hypothetical protein
MSIGPTFIDTFNSGASASSTGSNSDPIAINNSLSSNSSADSPTYGYNVTSATSIHHHHHHNHHNNQRNKVAAKELNNADNLLYIRTSSLYQHKTFPPLDETNFVASNVAMVKQQQQQQQQQQHQQPLQHGVHQSSSHYLNQQVNVNNGQKQNNQSVNSGYLEPPESGYSTPSRPKKVVYEVIV